MNMQVSKQGFEMSVQKSPMRVTFEGHAESVIIPLEACGWGYANAGCKLHRAARRCEVPQICDFFAPGGDNRSSVWFPVADGLASIAGLRAELCERPDSVCDAGCSLRDLKKLEHVLSAAPSARFRLSILTRREREALNTS